MLDDLRATLVDLLHELADSEVRLMLGGGYGLFLKQQHLTSEGTRTLIPPEKWPEARATNDIDLLLRPEIVTGASHMKTIRNALDRLGFKVVREPSSTSSPSPWETQDSSRLIFSPGHSARRQIHHA